MSLFGNKWTIVKIETNNIIKYEIYKRLFWGFYKLVKTCSEDEYKKFITENNIIIEK